MTQGTTHDQRWHKNSYGPALTRSTATALSLNLAEGAHLASNAAQVWGSRSHGALR